MRTNHFKFISKELSKEIMLGFKFRNKFLEDKTNDARTKYKKQHNIYVTYLEGQKEIIAVTLP